MIKESCNLENKKDGSWFEFLCTDDVDSAEAIHGCDREVACITSTLRSHEIDVNSISLFLLLN